MVRQIFYITLDYTEEDVIDTYINDNSSFTWFINLRYYFETQRCSNKAVLELPTTTHHSPPGLHDACLPTKLADDDSILWCRNGSCASSMLYFVAHDSSVSELNSRESVWFMYTGVDWSWSLSVARGLVDTSAFARGITGFCQLGSCSGLLLSVVFASVDMTSRWVVSRFKSQKKMLPAALQNASTGFWLGTWCSLKRMKNWGPQFGVWKANSRVYWTGHWGDVKGTKADRVSRPGSS